MFIYPTCIGSLGVRNLVSAGVLLRVDAPKAKEILSEIRKIEGVKNAVGVFGRYDIVVMLEAKDVDELGRIVTEKIAAIPGVRSTETLIAVSL
jgi:DNA-binding Lrp family transcriptional regulator